MKFQKVADRWCFTLNKQWVATENYKMWNFYIGSVSLFLSLTYEKGFKTTKNTIDLNSGGVMNTFYKK